MKNKLFALLFVLVPAIAQAQTKVSLSAWQEKAYITGAEASPAGGRLEVTAPFGLLGQSFEGAVRLDFTTLNGEPVDFSDPEKLGNHAEIRGSVARDIGGNLSVVAFGGVATALDKSPEPLQRYPREYGVGLRYTDKASGSTLDATVCRAEFTRPTFGSGQLCFSGEVPISFVRFGADLYLDVKHDNEGRDFLRVKAGVSVIDMAKAIKKAF